MKRLAGAREAEIIQDWILKVNMPSIQEAIEAIQEHGYVSEMLDSIIEEYQDDFDRNQVYCGMDNDTLMIIADEIYANLNKIKEYLPSSLYNELYMEDI